MPIMVAYFWAILKSIIGDFLSTAQKHNAQFLEHNSLMPNVAYLLCIC